MTKILLKFFLLLSTISFGQNSRQELAHSKIYVHASFYEQKNVFLGLQFRTDLVDTVLNDNRFVKFKMDYFQHSAQIDSSQIYYETFEKGLNTFVVPISGMEKDQYYRLNISYKSKEESGSISTGFNAKY